MHLPNAEIYAFGSRTKGTARKYSDLDLAIDAKSEIKFSTLTKLKEMISQTNLPITVDIVDYCAIGPEFKQFIDQKKVKI